MKVVACFVHFKLDSKQCLHSLVHTRIFQTNQFVPRALDQISAEKNFFMQIQKTPDRNKKFIRKSS